VREHGEAMKITRREFKKISDVIIGDVYASLPKDMRREADKIIILIEDHPACAGPEDDDYDLLGLFEGVPLNERFMSETASSPDTITLFRNALADTCRTKTELKKEIRLTLIHELGHYFGYSEDDLVKLGLG
jgi:predicted Zn-dependent protease with MMP-like domain